MSEKGLDKVVTFIRFLEKNADNNFLHRVNKKLNEGIRIINGNMKCMIQSFQLLLNLNI